MASAISLEQQREEGFGKTARKDAWWAGPLATLLGLLAFLIYANYIVFLVPGYFEIRQDKHTFFKPNNPAVAPVPRPLPLAAPLRRPEPSRLDSRRPARLVAHLGSLFLRDADSDLPRRLPPDVLLLPQGLLSRFLGRPARLCRRRAAQELLG